MMNPDQERSEYELRRFVIGQHPTPERQFLQAWREVVDAEYKLSIATLTREKTEIEIDELEATGSRVDAAEARIRRVHIARQMMVEESAERELVILRRILAEFGAGYTRDQIEAAEPEYWERRLSTDRNVLQVGAHRWRGELPSMQYKTMEPSGTELMSG
jgi:hypothetical protein